MYGDKVGGIVQYRLNHNRKITRNNNNNTNTNTNTNNNNTNINI